jgi:hypothetical protein
MATLQTSLEEVGRLRPTSTFNEAGYEWTVERLLQWLHQQFPALLGLPVYVLRPRIGDTSAIYETVRAGEMHSSMPLSWIERRPLLA